MRVPLDAHAGVDPIQRAYMILAVIGGLVCIGWLLSGWTISGSEESRYSPGPVSAVHSELACNDCHSNGPMRDDMFLADWHPRDVFGNPPWDRRSDGKCQNCHPMASQTTYQELAVDNQVPVLVHSHTEDHDRVGSCASCHREHRGTDHSLVDLANATCVDCHQDLSSCRRDPIPPSFQNEITSFEQHPKFRSLANDPGTIKFNHALHTSVGVKTPDQKDSLGLRLDDLALSDQTAFQSFTDAKGLIKLECQFCHPPADSSALSGTDYQFMQMPNYENHCRACHELKYRPSPNSSVVPHGKSAGEMLDHFQSAWPIESVTQPLESFDDWVPGATPVDTWRRSSSSGQVVDELKVTQLERAKALIHVRRQCAKCHSFRDDVFFNAFGDLSASSFPEIVTMPAHLHSDASKVFKTIWFTHGRLNHSAHINNIPGIQCIDCHSGAAAYPENDELITRPPVGSPHFTPLIDNNCLRCHREPAQVAGDSRPGPTNCVACHTYHGGGHRQALFGLPRQEGD